MAQELSYVHQNILLKYVLICSRKAQEITRLLEEEKRNLKDAEAAAARTVTTQAALKLMQPSSLWWPKRWSKPTNEVENKTINDPGMREHVKEDK